MTPILARVLESKAFVQHSPWDVSDGGAEETNYGLKCLPFFLHSPSGMSLEGVDVVLFNWGMHDGPMGNSSVPGQNLPPTHYKEQLQQITDHLIAFANSLQSKPKLVFVATTPFLCNLTSNGAVETLNNLAADIMSPRKIPVVSAFDAIIKKCGPLPISDCFGVKDCFCPHCPTAGYEWTVANVLAPAVQRILGERD